MMDMSNTWLTASIPSFPTAGYNVHFCHRLNLFPYTTTTSPQGGVPLYIAENIPYVVKNYVVLNSSRCESRFVEIPTRILKKQKTMFNN